MGLIGVNYGFFNHYSYSPSSLFNRVANGNVDKTCLREVDPCQDFSDHPNGDVKEDLNKV